MIRELTKLSNGRYSSHGGLPWFRELSPEATKETAHDAAVAWCTRYEKADRFGNMAQVLGVIRNGDKWCGVVNFFHSNT